MRERYSFITLNTEETYTEVYESTVSSLNSLNIRKASLSPAIDRIDIVSLTPLPTPSIRTSFGSISMEEF